MLLPVFAAGFAYPWCISVRSVTVHVFLKLIHFQTDRSSDYRFPLNIIPFEWFRLVSGTKNLGIFDEIKWATKMVYEIVPIWLGRISPPENILNNQGPFFHCSNEAIPLPRYIILLSTSFLAVDVSLRNHLGKTMKRSINKETRLQGHKVSVVNTYFERCLVSCSKWIKRASSIQSMCRTAKHLNDLVASWINRKSISWSNKSLVL